MSISHAQAVASLHVIVAVAQADGELHPEERKAIEAAIEEAELGDLIGPKALFDDDFELEEQLALLDTAEARDETFRSAYSLAFADGDCSPEERKLLVSLREKLGIPEQREQELVRVFQQLVKKPTDQGSLFLPVHDPRERATIIAVETRKCALLSALLGAFPVPGLALVTDLAVIALQVGLVRDIAALHGQKLDHNAAKLLLAGAGVTGARLAVSNLAKLLPGWGSVVGATTSFASTYAVGKVFERQFSQGRVDAQALRAEFKEAQAEGKLAFEANRAEIEAKQQTSGGAIERLARDARDGTLSHDELVKRAASLG